MLTKFASLYFTLYYKQYQGNITSKQHNINLPLYSVEDIHFIPIYRISGNVCYFTNYATKSLYMYPVSIKRNLADCNVYIIIIVL